MTPYKIGFSSAFFLFLWRSIQKKKMQANTHGVKSLARKNIAYKDAKFLFSPHKKDKLYCRMGLLLFFTLPSEIWVLSEIKKTIWQKISAGIMGVTGTRKREGRR